MSGQNEAGEILNVDEFNRGVDDYDEKREPPRITSWSYDKGRAFAARVPPCCRGDRNYPRFVLTGRCPHGA